MEVLVPLAGPDFELSDGSIKAEIIVDGQPLLVRALTSRSWWRRGEVRDNDLIFILRDTERSRAFASQRLRQWFPNSRTLFLSHPTAGAAFSALAGVALCDPEQILCVDLADILYDEAFDPQASFAASYTLGGMVPVFPSDWPLYSYVALAADGRATATAEKRVISTHASAGTYFFRNASVFMAAVNHAVHDKDQQTYRNSYFICPLFNGVIAGGLDVRTYDVTDVVDIKKVVTN